MARIVRFHEYGDASVLKIENLDVPPPGADEVQIDVNSIGFNRAEVMFRTHAYLQEAQFPSRLGYEAAGIVKTVVTSVTTFKKGDVVRLTAKGQCANCGATKRFAEAHLYMYGPGVVARCSASDHIPLRFVSIRERVFLDAGGMAYLCLNASRPQEAS